MLWKPFAGCLLQKKNWSNGKKSETEEEGEMCILQQRPESGLPCSRDESSASCHAVHFPGRRYERIV